MQPAFLPWAGYFNLISQADNFVFLDDVQLEKQSWQTRNRLIFNRQVHWVVIPIRFQHLGQSIAQTQEIRDDRWREKLLRSFMQNYGKHPHNLDAKEIIDLLLSYPPGSLATINEALIRHISKRIGISAHMHRASDLMIEGVRSDRLIELCKYFGADDYLSPIGSADYLAKDGFVERSPAKLHFQDYVPGPYEQKGIKVFHSHLSILDVIANLGWEKTRVYVEKGSV